MKGVEKILAARWHDFIDRDIERLLNGQEPHNFDLGPLKSFVMSAASLSRCEVPAQFIADHAAVAAATVAISQKPVVAATTPQSIRSMGSRMWNRFATGVAGIAILTGLTGVAVASNAAIPGDWNYAIDQALEGIGIGAGGSAERLDELAEMNQDGDPQEVLEITSGVLLTGGQSRASEALRAAAERVEIKDKGSDNAQAINLQLAELLRYLADNQGKIDGQSVAEMAGEIGHGGVNGQGQGQREGQGSGKGRGKDK